MSRKPVSAACVLRPCTCQPSSSRGTGQGHTTGGSPADAILTCTGSIGYARCSTSCSAAAGCSTGRRISSKAPTLHSLGLCTQRPPPLHIPQHPLMLM